MEEDELNAMESSATDFAAYSINRHNGDLERALAIASSYADFRRVSTNVSFHMITLVDDYCSLKNIRRGVCYKDDNSFSTPGAWKFALKKELEKHEKFVGEVKVEYYHPYVGAKEQQYREIVNLRFT
jgi:hypothetical protein